MSLKRLVTLVVLLAVIAVSVVGEGHAQKNLYYLVVGVESYADPPGGRSQFGSLPGLALGALRVADVLDSWGAKGGSILLSSPQRFVSRKDVFSALDAVIGQAKNDPAALIVFYFAGHGLSEGIAYNHFSIPGDYVGPVVLDEVMSTEEKTVYAGTVVNKLKQAGRPFMALLDTCYPADDESFRVPVLSATAQQNLRDVAGVLRYMNMFKEPNPVVFSTSPGDYVAQVPPPGEGPEAKKKIGPLARRLMLFDLRSKSRGAFSLDELVTVLRDPRFDPITKPAVSGYMPEQPLRIQRSPAGVQVAVAYGTAQEAQPALAQQKPDPTPEASVAARRLRCTLNVQGKNDWVTEGGSIHSMETVEVTSGSAGRELSISFENGELEFVAPQGKKLQQGTYRKSERAHMGSEARPGLSLSWNGHGCNEASGEFRIHKLDFLDQSEVVAFRATFTHVCDQQGSAKGEVVCGLPAKY